MSIFEMYIDKRWEYRFRLRAGNWQVILCSDWYSSQDGCMNAIQSVRENSQNDSRFIRKQTDTGCKFTLCAWNWQSIWEWEVMISDAALENQIASVSKNAPEAVLIIID